MLSRAHRRYLSVVAVCALACYLPPPLHAQQDRLYVANSEGDDIAVIDLHSMKAVDDIKVGMLVHGLAVQADGRRLFTTVESDHALRVIDTATDRNLSGIHLTGRPNQCAVTPDARLVAVSNADSGDVSIFDAQARREIAGIKTGKTPK